MIRDLLAGPALWVVIPTLLLLVAREVLRQLGNLRHSTLRSIDMVAAVGVVLSVVAALARLPVLRT
jgi:hypothetical protein